MRKGVAYTKKNNQQVIQSTLWFLKSILDFQNISVKPFSKAAQPLQQSPLIQKRRWRQAKLPGNLP
jgi:hypothetical protein